MSEFKKLSLTEFEVGTTSAAAYGDIRVNRGQQAMQPAITRNQLNLL